MINLPPEKYNSGIYYLSCPDVFKTKEDLYLKVREREGRIHNDEEVKFLPSVKQGHKHYNEWQLRKFTAQKLIKHLSSFSFLDILDVGAGNCWLSNLISTNTENFVYAMDVNEFELKQGAGVFSGNKRLKFVYGNIADDNFKGYLFDVILFSSSIQYFPDLTGILNKTFSLLRPEGYIIITDSNFYDEKEVIHAQERTKKYYTELGLPEAAQNYYHHSYTDLNKFRFIISEDGTFINKILAKTGLMKIPPFPWIKIYRQ